MTSSGNNFNDFPENQLTKFRAVSQFPWSWYHLGERRSPAFPLDYTTDSYIWSAINMHKSLVTRLILYKLVTSIFWALFSCKTGRGQKVAIVKHRNWTRRPSDVAPVVIRFYAVHTKLKVDQPIRFWFTTFYCSYLTHATLWPWSLTLWPWTFVVYRLWRVANSVLNFCEIE